jgi:hypothetical protein
MTNLQPIITSTHYRYQILIAKREVNWTQEKEKKIMLLQTVIRINPWENLKTP